jgi:hypothetical protein
MDPNKIGEELPYVSVSLGREIRSFAIVGLELGEFPAPPLE